MSFCTARAWLLEHMPQFDLHFLPGSVTVNGTSMLDDVIAFALMADAAAPWSATIPLEIKLPYLMPYASYHESRQNWRPLFFAKFFQLVANATSVKEAMERLIAPNVFTQWSEHYWPSSPRQPASSSKYEYVWSSSTAPPVVAPFDAIAYGYGSCSSWATFLTYVARSVGIPARQAGTPCWNSVYGGVDYRGLAIHNPNVSLCWHGGSSALGHGGGFLNNHNWVEVFLPSSKASPTEEETHRSRHDNTSMPPNLDDDWDIVNVPPSTKVLDDGLCGTFSSSRGCGFDTTAPPGHECDHVTGGPGAAMQDHEIFAVTWAVPRGHGSEDLEGGPIINVSALRLTNGEPGSPLVWSPLLSSPLGQPLRDVGLRVVNRTATYRCKPSKVGVLAMYGRAGS